jgi:hypothetical protein
MLRQSTDYGELLEKYNLLLGENRRLIEENERLKAQVGKAGRRPDENRIAGLTTEESIRDDEPTVSPLFSGINNRSDSISKIRLFMSLFKGRDDVYAKKWENKKKATSGYSPVCLNQWQVGLCGKPKTSCSKCARGGRVLSPRPVFVRNEEKNEDCHGGLSRRSSSAKAEAQRAKPGTQLLIAR